MCVKTLYFQWVGLNLPKPDLTGDLRGWQEKQLHKKGPPNLKQVLPVTGFVDQNRLSRGQSFEDIKLNFHFFAFPDASHSSPLFFCFCPGNLIGLLSGSESPGHFRPLFSVSSHILPEQNLSRRIPDNLIFEVRADAGKI